MKSSSPTSTVILGDCLTVMRSMASKSVDLVLTSPPYEDARTYGIGFDLKGQDWVDWAVPRYLECVRICKGLVCWVVEGKTKNYRWSATPALLMADLHRAGVRLRKPPIYRRDGIPGSGGPDWLANKYEFCICSSEGKLPWSDNTAMGHPPKCGIGGAMSNRLKNGTRTGKKDKTSSRPDGNKKGYQQPKLANPGNIIDCGAVGGGNIGSDLASENEAPFPEKLASFFVRSFSPPNGIVLDCFSGSGTTAAMALRWNRNAISIDCREEMTNLTKRRVKEWMNY